MNRDVTFRKDTAEKSDRSVRRGVGRGTREDCEDSEGTDNVKGEIQVESNNGHKDILCDPRSRMVDIATKYKGTILV